VTVGPPVREKSEDIRGIISIPVQARRIDKPDVQDIRLARRYRSDAKI
jgi:hypothetical protein